MEGHTRRTLTETASQPRKCIPLVLLCFGLLFMIIASLLTGLLFNRSPPGNVTAVRFLEARNHRLTDERDRLKQKLQTIDKYTSESWVYFQGSLYLGSDTQQSWQESRLYCQKKGANLIIINNEQEQGFAHLTFKDLNWIGLSDQEHEGTWKWVDGSLLTTSFWNQGEPNNRNRIEDCGQLNFGTGFRNWNDDDCSRKFKCICEKSTFQHEL